MKNFFRKLKIFTLILFASWAIIFSIAGIYLGFTYQQMKKEFFIDLEKTRNSNWVKYEDFPKLLIDTTILIEDPHFRECGNLEIWRQYYRVFFKGDKEINRCNIGFYVARLASLQKKEGMLRWHLRLFFSTQALFANYSREQILEEYFNRVYMGLFSGKILFGYPKAAKEFFQKDLNALNKDEIAHLVGMVHSPSLYSPLLNESKGWKRIEFVLQKMQEAGLIK